MADNTILNTNVTSGDVIATEDIAGVKHELVKLEFGAAGVATKVSAADPLPVDTGLTQGTTPTDTQPISVTSLPLPTGAATGAKQDTGNTSLASIDGKLTSPLTVQATNLDIRDLSSGTDSVTVTGTVSTGLTQPLTDAQLRATPVPVSGTVSVDTTGLATSAKQDTGNTSLASIDTKLTNPLPVSAASLPLPALAATSTKQSDGSQKSQVVDGSGNVIGATSNALDINIKSGNISGFATSSKQDTGNTSLASIDSKLTNPLPISGTVAITNLDVALSTRTKPSDQQHAIIDSGTITTVSAVTAISNALPAGSNVIGHVIADSGSTTAVTGNVTAVQATGTNLHTVVDSGTITAVTAITNNVNTVEVAPTTVLNGKKTVTTAGSRVTLAGSTACKSVTIKALKINTGIIYVGDTSVASTNGFQLYPGESVSMDIANLTTVNLDSSVNGEGVSYLAVN